MILVSRFSFMSLFERMRQRLSLVDFGFLVVLAVSLLAIYTFLSRSGLPQVTDAELHIYRLAELSRLFRAGEFFPRWAPNFYYGYGYPIFNYYAPLTYYLGLGIDFMPVLGPVAAVKGLFIIGLLGAGLGIYGYVRDIWGRAAGVVAAATYVYSPYMVYIDPQARGDLAEAFSFAVFPMALWAMDRLRRQPNSWNWIASSTLIAALILTHNLMAMVFVGLLLSWAIWQEIVRGAARSTGERNGRLGRILRIRLFLALLAGIGMAAVFWLVVALEQDAVNLSSLIGDGGHFDYRNHFLTIKELLSGSLLLDWGASEPEYVMNLGIGQWLLAVLGVITIISGRARSRNQALYYIIAGLLLLSLMLSLSTPIWNSIPLFPFLQFPWRFLGPLAAIIAILAGVGIGTLVDVLPSKVGLWIPAAAVALIILLALPLVQVPPWPSEFGPTTARGVLAEELAGRWLGTTSTADFVPATVETLPKPEKSLLEAIFDNRPIDRVNRVTLPEGTSVTFEEITPLYTIYKSESDRDFFLRLFLFDFPGWETRIDGDLVETAVGRPEGFIVIPVPEGNHVIEVEFQNTPARTLALGITLISVAFVLIIAWFMRGYSSLSPEDNERVSRLYNRSDNLFLWPILGVAIIVLFINASLIEPRGLLHYDFDGQVAQPAAEDVFIDFGGQLALIGYDSPEDRVKLGERFSVTAYWKLLSEPITNYQVFVHVFDSDGVLVAQSDKLNPGDYPVRRWPEDKYVRDEHEIELPVDLEPGEYTIGLGLWVADKGWRLPVLDQDGNSLGDSFVISHTLIAE